MPDDLRAWPTIRIAQPTGAALVTSFPTAGARPDLPMSLHLDELFRSHRLAFLLKPTSAKFG
jgi:hypothetical protein